MEKAPLELPPPEDIVEEGIGFDLEYVLMQHAGLHQDGGQHKTGSYTHADAEVIAATVSGMAYSSGSTRLAIRVAGLARAGRIPDRMRGVVPGCVTAETPQNPHGVRAVTRGVGTERVQAQGQMARDRGLGLPRSPGGRIQTRSPSPSAVMRIDGERWRGCAMRWWRAQCCGRWRCQQ